MSLSVPRLGTASGVPWAPPSLPESSPQTPAPASAVRPPLDRGRLEGPVTRTERPAGASMGLLALRAGAGAPPTLVAPILPGIGEGGALWGATRGGFTSPSAFDPERYQLLVRMAHTDVGGTPHHLEMLRGMVAELTQGADTFTSTHGGQVGAGRVIHASVMNQTSSRPFMHAHVGVVFETDGSHVIAARSSDMMAWQDPALRGLSARELAVALHAKHGIASPAEVLKDTLRAPGNHATGGGNNDVALYVPPAHGGAGLRATGLVVFSRPEWGAGELYTPSSKSAVEALGAELGLPVLHVLELQGDRTPAEVRAMWALRR